jgi:chromosome segregation ATPase
MTDQIREVLRRNGRFVWGGAAVLLLLVLVGSVVLPDSSDAEAESDAQARAESLSGSFIEQELSPALLARDITGAASRHLTVLVQAVIRSDDRFTTVRIWRLDGALIYSTAQGDDTSVIAAGDRWIDQALEGRTVSVLSSAGTYHEGLERPAEEQFQTFVPITLSDGTVDGVVQIDQRSSSINSQSGSNRRPLQLVVLLLLIGAGVMFVRWLRQAQTNQEDGPAERRAGHGRRAEDQDVLARADRAERAARETEGRVRELEAALAAGPTTAALEELDLKLRASEADREEFAATIQRLQATLSDRDADVALARDGSDSPANAKRINTLIADAESRVATAERKAADAERKTEEAAKRATISAERALEMEAQLKEAEQRAADAQKLAATENERGSGADGKVGEAERKAEEAQQRATEAAERATQAERQARELSGTAAEAEKRAGTSLQRALAAERRVGEVERRASEVERRAAEVERRAAEVERRAADDAAGVRPHDSADRGIAAKLKRTEDERDQLVARVDQLEHATTKAPATPPNGKSSKRGSRSSRASVAENTSNSNQRRSRSRTPG